ncbi:DUF1127 domain-containing protein [Roseibium salinum]|uniref:DUF1127 domain-containing protein n=1 Tax=Roseibium salinum TaxID=1604349 RepID=A0ABT3R4D0_9HYPH|nr:DUF1127 domain-containing protein [Roseibium sp. DSM 29163]MCX2723911.1 DUF1127 domain-containing protein [Roseibium sp. DSM 29163]
MTHSASTPFFALLGQAAVRAWRVYSNRRQIAELKHWTDDQLKDIGLTRSDVRRALAQPFYSDPTSVLNASPALRQAPNYSAANAPTDKPELTLVETRKSDGKLAA